MQVTDVFYSDYLLHPLSGRAPRVGALLQLHFSNGMHGYADCHPWYELGDLPLPQQLSLLKNRSFETPLLTRALYFSRLDAQYRSEKKYLLDGLTLPSSHFLVSSTMPDPIQIKAEEFTHVKMKVEKETLEETIRCIKSLSDADLVVRLDFNLCLSEPLFLSFLEKITPFIRNIDFFEDPFPYDASRWKAIQQERGVVLARDRFNEGGGTAAVTIWKPAVEEAPPTQGRLIVTSYLDHPIGQVYAAYEAARQGTTEVCGLLSHRAYQPTPFSEVLSSKGPFFTKGEGTGCGFDDLLAEMEWKRC